MLEKGEPEKQEICLTYTNLLFIEVIEVLDTTKQS